MAAPASGGLCAAHITSEHGWAYQAPGSRGSCNRRTLQQLDRDAFGSGEEGDARSGPDRHRFTREDRALGFEVGADGVDVFDLQPEMIEALVGMRRPCAGLRIAADVKDEDVGAAEFQVDARLA